MPRGRSKKEVPVISQDDEKKFFDRLVNVHREINTLAEDLKTLKGEIKDAGGNAALLSKAAAAHASSDPYSVVEKNKEINEAIEKFDNQG